MRFLSLVSSVFVTNLFVQKLMLRLDEFKIQYFLNCSFGKSGSLTILASISVLLVFR